VRPSWATARAAIYGDLLELGPDELGLTPEEGADVLVDAPLAFREEFLAQANGWPAVIGLAALARSPRRTPDDAVSSTLFRFFAEEIFATAPPTLQEDLLAMALLPALTRALMDRRFGATERR
jgi:ATP/maltotriose-dependent transcriptional regulator MalT